MKRRSSQKGLAIHAVRRTLTFAATLTAVAWALVHLRALAFVCDDAFIVFRYADHLAAGHGPIFNPGERVEGYTSPLWLALLALGIRAGVRPEIFAPLLGAGLAAGTLIAVVVLLVCRGKAPFPFAFLVAGCSAWAAWATGGLETSLFTSLVTFAFFATLEETGPRSTAARLRASSALVALATMTRPDGLLVACCLGLYLARKLRTRNPRALIAWAAGWVLPFVGQSLARYAYYGRWWPNTAAVKSGGLVMLPSGLGYLGDALVRLPLLPVILVLVAQAIVLSPKSLGKDRNVLAALVVIPYLAFVAWAGGDFMDQFRFVAPLVPILLWVTSESLTELAPRLGRAGPIAVTLFVASWLALGVLGSRRSLEVAHAHHVDSIGLLRKHVTDWSAIGIRLRSLAAPTDSVAVTAAGCIPYWSGLFTIDQFGLVAPDLRPYIERQNHGPGHRLLLRGDELMRLRPQFLVGGPLLAEDPMNARAALWLDDSGREGLAREYTLGVFAAGDRALPRYFMMAVRRDLAARVR